MGWHPTGVTKTRIRVIRVNFREMLIKGKENYDQASEEFELSEFEFSGCTVVVFLYFPYAFHDYNAMNKS